jgi:hypothetical protein
MKNLENSVKDWTQQALFPAPVVRISLHVGIMREAGHAQIQLEVWDESGSELVGMSSRPHLDLRDLPDYLRTSVRELSRLVNEVTGPF